MNEEGIKASARLILVLTCLGLRSFLLAGIFQALTITNINDVNLNRTTLKQFKAEHDILKKTL